MAILLSILKIVISEQPTFSANLLQKKPLYLLQPDWSLTDFIEFMKFLFDHMLSCAHKLCESSFILNKKKLFGSEVHQGKSSY